MNKRLFINADAGESFGAWTMGRDEELIPHVDVVNVACGMHAGDPCVMRRTLALCKRYGKAAGAHPSYPDRQGFGRREMALSPAEIEDYLLYQMAAVAGMARAEGLPLFSVKLHGALYHRAATCGETARATARAIRAVDPGLTWILPPRSAAEEAARMAGLQVAREVFADRTYQEDGTLTPRGFPGAVIACAETCAANVRRMLNDGGVRTTSATLIPLAFETLCIHGDTLHAPAVAQAISAELRHERAPGTFYSAV